MTRLAALAAAVLFASGVASFGQPASSPPAELDGEWRLNYELSDEPRRSAPRGVGAAPRDSRSRPGGWGPGLGRWGGAAAGRGESRADADDADRVRVAVADQLTAPRVLTVTQEVDEILFRYSDGRYVRVVPDGREHAGLSGRSQIARTTRWEGRRLVVDVRLEGQYRIRHTIERGRGGRRLTMTTVLMPTDAHDEVRLVRVYDAADDLAR